MNYDRGLRLRVSKLSAAAGISWLIVSVVSLISNDPEHYIDALMLLPLVLTLAGVVGLHVLQRAYEDRLERIGFRALAFSIGLMVFSQPGIVFDISWLSWLAFPVGFLGFLVGLALFGAGSYRVNVLPHWAPIALGASQLLTILAGLALSPISPVSDYGDYSGAVVHGIVWLSIAYALRGTSFARPFATEHEQVVNAI